ncbi:penicillin-binding protein [Candidatus Kaiserbacteria bacterium]|nr:penicillin-binding protein [Candidatus Kaiserbacteria bacterium]
MHRLRRHLRPLKKLEENTTLQWLKLAAIGAFSLFLFIFGAMLIWAAIMPIPSINNFEARQVAESTKIYDRTGNIVLYDVHGTVRRTSVPIEEISPYIRNATIAIEDSTFYTNAGFRPLSLARAIFVDITSGSYRQGGSTITQQVVKNALLSQNKTILRKLQEIILALRLTRIYSKDQILNTYLNESPYGGTLYGVQEASQYFFGIDAKDVDLAQAAYLAAIPQAPTYYSPYGNNRESLDRRKDLVLQRMKVLGHITPEEYETAKNEKVEFRIEKEAGIKAPHFVFFIRQYLEEKYGVDAVNNEGLRVITTLDYDLQEKAESVIRAYAPGMQGNFNASNMGLVAIDPKTGHILTMVGSKEFFSEDIDGQVNVTIAHRQPGSSFKPFVYAAAFAKGYTPETIVFDLQTQFSTACSVQDVANNEPPCYSPQNYDETFKGPMTLRNALAQSQNIPAIKTLYLANIQNSINLAESFGISTLGDPDRYGLTLVLGGGEVTLLDMTSAYGVFANDGVRNPSTGILEIRDNRGHVLEKYEDNSERVLDPQVARLINNVLSDNIARTPAFGASSPLHFPGMDIAAKTGTTNDSRDAWIIGYSPSIVVGAWAGNNDNSPMFKKVASFIVAPPWHEVVMYATEKYPADRFTPPSPDPDILTTPSVLRGNWNTDPSRGVHEILFWVQRDNPRLAQTGNPYSDSQFPYWDHAVQLWMEPKVGSSTPSGEGPFPTTNLPTQQTTTIPGTTIPLHTIIPQF